MKYIVNPFNGEIDYVSKDASATLITDVISELDATHNIAPSPKAVKDYVDKVLSESNEIPQFSGIIEGPVNVENNYAYNREGAVYFAKKASIDGKTVKNVFIYKVRDTYYNSWHERSKYTNDEKNVALENKLFECDDMQYIYSDGFLAYLKMCLKQDGKNFNVKK